MVNGRAVQLPKPLESHASLPIAVLHACIIQPPPWHCAPGRLRPITAPCSHNSHPHLCLQPCCSPLPPQLHPGLLREPGKSSCCCSWSDGESGGWWLHINPLGAISGSWSTDFTALVYGLPIKEQVPQLPLNMLASLGWLSLVISSKVELGW